MSSSSGAGRFIYDVFLSFRGSDTRHGFVSHLYDALKQKGISTFKDDQKLERGKLISPEILRVIQRSRLSIVIFSKDYASSPWCLEELQCIIQCTEEEETRAVLPVFYGIDPSDVSEVKNSYAESFARHYDDNPENTEMIGSWRDALDKAAEFSGWDSRHRDEPSLIDEIVADVLNKLGRDNSKKPLGHLVGMKPRIKEVELLLRTGLADVRMVGIWGMPGIGKTTTAEAVYHHISHQFDACCFLKSVREVSEKHGLDYMRNKLLSALIVEDGLRILDEQLDALIRGRLRNKHVLIVLDDVSSLDQLTSLAGEREWFGPGSRIIITTKDKHLLEQHQVDSVYEVKLLSCEESTELLHQRAFKKKPLPQDFEEVSERVVNYAKGFPLAIEVLGLSLFNMNKEEWESKLNMLEEEPPGDLVKILGLSLDMLERSERNMFLDVACFLNGESTDYVVSILEGFGFSPHYGLKVLVNRSLLTIQDDKVSMPDLLQHLGREIVRRESFSDAGRRSRLWKHEDVCNVLTQNSGTSNVEVIILDISKLNNEMSLEVEAFHKMNRLRLLKIFWPDQSGASEFDTKKDSYETVPRVCPVGRKLHLLGNLRMLSNELRSLHWHGYPFESLPSYFNPDYIVELNLSHSSLKILWIGKKVFEKLKVMKLSYSHELIQTPDFSGIRNLEILVLEGCVKLTEVHPSVGCLEKLVYLNLNGCSNLCQLPVQLGYLQNLEEIHADGTSLGLSCFMPINNCVPPLRKNLTILTLRGSSAVRKSWSIVGSHFMTLPFNRTCPFSFQDVGYLQSLDLSYCDLMHFQHDISGLFWLTKLDLSGNGISDFPSGFEFPMRLEVVTLANCKNLVRIPCLPAARHTVVAPNCPSLRLIDSPRSITKEGKRDFDLMNCSSIAGGGWADLARNIYRVVRRGRSSSSSSTIGVDLEFLEWLGVVDYYEKDDAPFVPDEWYDDGWYRQKYPHWWARSTGAQYWPIKRRKVRPKKEGAFKKAYSKKGPIRDLAPKGDNLGR